VKYRFDIVSVGIQYKRSVVPKVVRPLAGRTVVATSGTEGSLVERDDRFTIGSLKGEVNPRNLFVRLVYEQLVNVEVAVPLYETPSATKRGNDGKIKALAGLYV
jgi:hypothetical protein